MCEDFIEYVAIFVTTWPDHIIYNTQLSTASLEPLLRGQYHTVADILAWTSFESCVAIDESVLTDVFYLRTIFGG